MKNYVKDGDVLNFTAPAGGVVSGTGYLIGETLAVAQTTEDAGDKFAGLIEGVVTMPKLSTDVMAEGVKVNWDDTNKRFTTTTSDKDDTAIVEVAAGNGDTEVTVKLWQ